MGKAVTMVLLAALVGVASGCMTSSGGIAPSNRPLEPNSYALLDRVSGTSWGVSVLWLFPVSQASTSEALEKALAQKNADAIVQITVDNSKFFVILGLAYIEWTKVEGIAVKVLPQPR